MADFKINLSIQDEDGAVANVTFHIVQANIGAAITRAQALMTAVDAIIGGQIVDCVVGQVVTPISKGSPAAGSDNEVKGRFIFNSSGGFLTRVSLPSFLKDTYTVVGGLINTSDSDIVAFLDEVIDNAYSDYRWADVESLKSAYEAFGQCVAPT